MILADTNVVAELVRRMEQTEGLVFKNKEAIFKSAHG